MIYSNCCIEGERDEMGLPSDDPVIIRPPDNAGEPTVITISCPDKTGLGCDLCRVILFFGLSVVRGDISTDGKWCFILFWVVERRVKTSDTRWGLLKKRLLEACPVASSSSGIYNSYYKQQEIMAMEKQPQIFLLKLSCSDRMGLLHDVTKVLCELELTIRRVKVSTTPDGRAINLFFVTDARELLHTKRRKDETCDHLKAVLGEFMISFDIEHTLEDITACLRLSSTLPSSIAEEMLSLDLSEEASIALLPSSSRLSVTMDNSLSPSHTLIQIHCPDQKGLLYDIMRTLKDYNIQISYGRFYSCQGKDCEIDLFVVQMDGKKIIDPNKQKALSSRLKMNLFFPLRVALVNRGPDLELFVANPVELSGKGRPLVLYDITLALKMLQIRIFLAEIGRHTIGDSEWEVYRILLNDEHDLSSSMNKIVDGVTKMLMGWDLLSRSPKCLHFHV